MNESNESFEKFLKGFTPSTPSDELMQRLGSAMEQARWEEIYEPAPELKVERAVASRLQAWIMPACAAATVAVAGLWLYMAGQHAGSRQPTAQVPAGSVVVPGQALQAADVRTTDMGLMQDQKGQTYRLVRWEWNEAVPGGPSSDQPALRRVLMPVKLEQP